MTDQGSLAPLPGGGSSVPVALIQSGAELAKIPLEALTKALETAMDERSKKKNWMSKLWKDANDVEILTGQMLMMQAGLLGEMQQSLQWSLGQIESLRSEMSQTAARLNDANTKREVFASEARQEINEVMQKHVHDYHLSRSSKK